MRETDLTTENPHQSFNQQPSSSESGPASNHLHRCGTRGGLSVGTVDLISAHAAEASESVVALRTCELSSSSTLSIRFLSHSRTKVEKNSFIAFRTKDAESSHLSKASSDLSMSSPNFSSFASKSSFSCFSSETRSSILVRSPSAILLCSSFFATSSLISALTSLSLSFSSLRVPLSLDGCWTRSFCNMRVSTFSTDFLMRFSTYLAGSSSSLRASLISVTAQKSSSRSRILITALTTMSTFPSSTSRSQANLTKIFR
mmetsp:Transcript_5206/g.12467  ORF Transcript_5206/g.12467 Transcript_5206/m.12467 type:complete len:258 (+) Transcript_5206:98-871(+)